MDGPKSANGVTVQEYLIGKRDSYVVVAQLSPEFTARLVDRWQELETQASRPALPANYAAALRELASTVEVVEQQQALISEQRPKVEFYDQFVKPMVCLGTKRLAPPRAALRTSSATG